jgi:hypothetical protein
MKDHLAVSPAKKGMPEKRESFKRSNSPAKSSENELSNKGESTKPNVLAGLGGIKPNKSLHTDIKAKLAMGIKNQMSGKKITLNTSESPVKSVAQGGSDKDINTPSSLKKPAKFGQSPDANAKSMKANAKSLK